MSWKSKDNGIRNVLLFTMDLQSKIRTNNCKLSLFQAGVEDKIDIRIKPAVETLGKDEIQYYYYFQVFKIQKKNILVSLQMNS